MPIESGSRIGPYQVTSPLGEGGMGVVYRARDTKLQRDVALKLLPEHFAKDPDRLSRFRREAQLLASLNHPNIAQIYGLEEVDGMGCIVMEFVDGETLSQRLKRGPIAVDEAIEIVRQVAEALAAAHERGIVHRDLKPANIALTPSGTVKVLDFGLAKALGTKATDSSLSALPTSSGSSVPGLVVGTAGYMSPEQARGREVDARTDIWAFGCVLYEMLTGRLAFEGETMTDIMARILTGQPDLGLLPAETPASVRALLAATLNKNAQQRLQHIGDMRLFLDKTLVAASDVASAFPQRRAIGGKLFTAALGVALLAALIPAVLYFRRPAVDALSMRLELSLPGLVNNAIAVSPDGQKFAYLVQSNEGVRSIWVRAIGAEKAQQLAGTEGANGLLWSPDNRHLAFMVSGKLKKTDISGGPVQMICDIAGARNFTWNRDGVILFGRGSDNVIVRVQDSGGDVKPVVSLDASRKEILQTLPSFLPDGNHFLYASVSTPETIGIYVASLDSKTPPKRVMPSSLNRTFGLAYAEPGYFLLQVEGRLTAQRFDTSGLRLEGDPITLADEVEGGFSVSDTGILTFRKPAPAESNKKLQWIDRQGRQSGQLAAAADYGGVALSPNGDRVAVDIINNNNKDIWVIDLARAVPSRITFDPAIDWSAQWSPDGSRLAFASAGRNTSAGALIYQKSSSGVGDDEVVPTDVAATVPVHWSPDNKYIVFSRTKNPGTDTWLLPLFGDRKAKPFLESPFDKIQAQVSPDGKWLAYATNESGAFQIVVQSFPDSTGGKWQISAEGGVEPKWRRDGRELFYLAFDGKLMSVSIKGDRTIEAGRPVVLFQTPLTVNRTRPDADRRYDVSRDGQSFLVVTPDAKVNAVPLTVLVNWPSVAKK